MAAWQNIARKIKCAKFLIYFYTTTQTNNNKFVTYKHFIVVKPHWQRNQTQTRLQECHRTLYRACHFSLPHAIYIIFYTLLVTLT